MRQRMDDDHPYYKSIVLSNTTLGMLLATINASIVLISLPAIVPRHRPHPARLGKCELSAGDTDWLPARETSPRSGLVWPASETVLRGRATEAGSAPAD
jgi:hypothetical protein